MNTQKHYTKDGKERPPTLHEIICCEANVMDCEEGERIEKLIKEYYLSKVPSIDKIEEVIVKQIDFLNKYEFAHKKIFEITKQDYFRPIAQAIHNFIIKSLNN